MDTRNLHKTLVHSGALWLVTIYTEIVSIKLYFGTFNIKLYSVTDIEQRVRRGDVSFMISVHGITDRPS